MTTRHRRAPDRRYARPLRTTLQIDDDVLEAARCIADDERVSVGEVLSRLARRGLEPRPDEPAWARLPPSVVPRVPASRGGAPWRRAEGGDPW